MARRCPKCKSDNILKISRRKYLLRVALCLVIILACCSLLVSLSREDFDLVVVIGLAGSGIAVIASTVMAIIFLVKGIRTTQTIYHCNFCDKRVEPLIVEDPTAYNRLQQIRRN